MIDALQRLDIDYHFSEEINSLLREHNNNFNGSRGGRIMESLHDVALSFRLLRQHGYYVSADVFNKYKDGKGRFRAEVAEDIRGMLALYEASHLGIEGEDELDKARVFASKHLESSAMRMNAGLSRQVQHILKHPFHLNLPKFNAKFYLNNSSGSVQGKMRIFHELAQLSFNVGQALHQRELEHFSTWWRDMGLAQQLRFARDQPVKWSMWSIACLPHPEFSNYRVQITKPVAFVYLIDDIFDTHGTLDELVLFTEAVNSWDDDAINKLPGYMKTCFMALNKTTNEIADMVLRHHGWDPLVILRKSWAMLCDAFLVEAKWFACGHSPKADEYLKNGVISSGVPTVLIHLLSLLGERVTEEADHDLVDNIPGLISYPASILRLWDDLGSAKDEKQQGHDGSYLDYHMQERGKSLSLQDAREHVMHLIDEEWKKLNKACLSPNRFSSTFTVASLNSARMVQVMYSYDDHQRLEALEQHINTLIGENDGSEIKPGVALENS
ncbi:(3S,6E)-nerolidol synthase 2, chloroplastic/mitochondrial-like [Aristolochia californica]